MTINDGIVYVVAWQYGNHVGGIGSGGSGFDCYYTPEEADQAFEKEKKKADAFTEEKWTCYRFNFKTDLTIPSKIFEAINRDLGNLCDKSDRRYAFHTGELVRRIR
jgi:hypothetical protein